MNGSLIYSYATHKDIVTCIALSEDDQTIVTGSIDNNVHIYLNAPGFGLVLRKILYIYLYLYYYIGLDMMM